MDEKEKTSEVKIWDLGDEKYQLMAPLSISIEEYPGDEAVIARLPELEVFGEGFTDSEAIHNLKMSILDLYDELTEIDIALLDDLPRTWLRTLKKTITFLPGSGGDTNLTGAKTPPD